MSAPAAAAAAAAPAAPGCDAAAAVELGVGEWRAELGLEPLKRPAEGVMSPACL